jgi:methyl-accepting chemotaxis protein
LNKIWIKLALSGVLLGLIMAIALAFFMIRSDNEIKDSALVIIGTLLRDSFDQQVEDQVKTAVTMMDSLELLVDNGTLSEEQARLVGYHMVREARYGVSGYFWGDDPDGTNRILYGNSDVENKIRINAKDDKNNLFIQEIIKKGQNGGGFTDFWFPKEGKLTLSLSVGIPYSRIILELS